MRGETVGPSNVGTPSPSETHEQQAATNVFTEALGIHKQIPTAFTKIGRYPLLPEDPDSNYHIDFRTVQSPSEGAASYFEIGIVGSHQDRSPSATVFLEPDGSLFREGLFNAYERILQLYGISQHADDMTRMSVQDAIMTALPTTQENAKEGIRYPMEDADLVNYLNVIKQLLGDKLPINYDTAREEDAEVLFRNSALRLASDEVVKTSMWREEDGTDYQLATTTDIFNSPKKVSFTRRTTRIGQTEIEKNIKMSDYTTWIFYADGTPSSYNVLPDVSNEEYETLTMPGSMRQPIDITRAHWLRRTADWQRRELARKGFPQAEPQQELGGKRLLSEVAHAFASFEQQR